MKISNLRKEYQLFKLNLNALSKNPLKQLDKWMGEAVNHKIIEPNAMVLATADKRGRPSSRVVLLKEIDTKGLIFYTGYETKKACDMLENPYASVTFHWKELERQVSFTGKVKKLETERARRYFESRPRDSQISALASKQGCSAPSRLAIEKAFAEEEKKWQGRSIPKPETWGGFILVPEEATFWQGREKRLHDRFLYRKADSHKWSITRLYP